MTMQRFSNHQDNEKLILTENGVSLTREAELVRTVVDFGTYKYYYDIRWVVTHNMQFHTFGSKKSALVYLNKIAAKNAVSEVNFIVVAVSSNTNSFGLKQFIVVAKNGMTYKLHGSMYNCPSVGDVVKANVKGDNAQFFGSYELPTKMANCPNDVVEEIWVS